MKQAFLAPSVILAGLTTTVVSCDSGNPVGPAMKRGTAVTAPMPEGAFISAVSSPGRADNDEGGSHYKQGHMDVATNWLQKAVKADPRLAKDHYNLGLSLDKMGKHVEATAAFKLAAAQAPANPH